jgi:ferrous iron transport protein B
MDKIMHKIGLHGKSFIPLIMGFGCNVPAIMATRTIENRTSRIVTMLINPLFSCSARLPVYVLIISAFSPKYPGLILFSIYMFGIILASIMAVLFRKFIFRKNEIPFVMELPPYRVPNPRATTRHMWTKGEQYIKKMGGVILTASIIIWALGYFPRNAENSKVYENKISAIRTEYENKVQSTGNPLMKNQIEDSKSREIEKITLQKDAEQQKNSYAGRIGQFIEPIMSPLGFDWRMSLSLLSGIAAKEVIISTMGILYQAKSTDKDDKRLIQRLQESSYQSGPQLGKKIFNPLVAFSFIAFILIYFPCIAVITAIGNESGSWKIALFEVGYTTALAWLVSFLIYQIGSLFI